LCLIQLFIFRSPKEAPCGSLRIENRPPEKSCGANISCAPCSTALWCDNPESTVQPYAEIAVGFLVGGLVLLAVSAGLAREAWRQT